ncbi:MAG: peptide ligase PGM1-related protein [Acidobacteriota bacterium]
MIDPRLAHLWRAIEAGDPAPHTSIVVPSLSFDTEELAKISGAPFYEERLLFSLMRLRDPRARVIYVTSQPLHPEIVDYYLGLLVGVSPRSARSRLELFCCYDATARPLTEKILERPRLIERIRQSMGHPEYVYLTCFNSTALEKRLADQLGVSLNGCDPALLDLGGKSGSREIFRAAGVPLPRGRERLRSVAEVVEVLDSLYEPGLERAVIKLDHSFAGAGNAVFRYPRPMPEDPEARLAAIRRALRLVEFNEPSSVEAFFSKLHEMGGIVEEMVQGDEVRSPSVQMRILPTGELEIVSTHDQILGGGAGQSYSGCRFPADPVYRRVIQDEALKVGEALSGRGVVSRFAVDFVTVRRDDGDGQSTWRAYAIEINLRMGGTTVPFQALQFLTGGHLRAESGEFVAPSGQSKFYRATDSLTSPAYCGLLPEDLMDVLDTHGLGFSSDSKTGVLFHMMGALSEHGKVGVTTIGDTAAEAESFFRRTVEVLDLETSPTPSESPRRVQPPPSQRLPME